MREGAKGKKTMNIAEADAAYKRAAENLINIIKKELPIGTIIQAKIGRAIVVGPVTGYGWWWSNPGEIRFENEQETI
jgi:hypothetical protein